MVGSAAGQVIVVRVIPYRDADVVAHLLGSEAGAVAALVHGARRQKSRYRSRIEPLAEMTATLSRGRGDLWRIGDARDHVDRPHLRSSWLAQQAATIALEVAWQSSDEGGDPHATFWLCHRMLDVLDRTAAHPERLKADAAALLVGHGTKLLVAAGYAPRLAACIRCGDDRGLGWFSIEDGGTACTGCVRPGDLQLEDGMLPAMRLALTHPLADLPGQASEATWTRVLHGPIRRLVEAHLGVRMRRMEEGPRPGPARHGL